MATPSRPPADLLRPGLTIGGRRLMSASGGTFEHVNPATGEVQQVFPLAGPREIDEAVAAARAALPDWRAWQPAARRDALRALAGLLRAHAREFADISSLESGLLASFTAGMSAKTAEWFDYYAGWIEKLPGTAQTWGPFLNYALPEPIGVVAIVLTWNGPTGSIGMKVAAALAAGCSVVLKPPELAPFSCNLFGELCARAGLPDGVVNVVVGGPEAGAALVEHPGIDKISFTGGPDTARHIQAGAARALTPLVLELGGKSASLVFEDAEPAVLGRLAARSAAFMNGQLCVAPTRLLVARAVYDQVVEQAAAEASALRPGDPFDDAADVGPVINEAAHVRILGVVDRARTEGAGELVAGGFAVGERGYFVQPTVFAGVDPASELARNEVFGPVLAITGFDDEDEAVALANDTPYGLAAYVHTRDLSRAHRVAARLDAGNIAINGGMPVAGPYAAFGGFKDSGYGKEGGYPGIAEYLRVKNVSVNVG